MNTDYFTKNVEKMIDPIDVGTIHFMQQYTDFIPIELQNKMITNGSRNNPYMGLVVEPYSFFLCYEIIDLDWATRLIPDNYQLIKTKIFDEDIEKYYGIFGCFNTHTSAFWGTRMEFYIIAESKDTNLLSWVIVDCDTNTISFDINHGLSGGNTSECIFTTNYDGDVIIDIKNSSKGRSLVANCSITQAQYSSLYSRLWLEGNLSITYGREISKNNGSAFAVAFNPKEVSKALRISSDDLIIEGNTWYPGLFEEQPSNILCFPFAQHFLSDSPGHYSSIKNEQELTDFVRKVNFDNISNYSSKPIKKAFKHGQIISVLLIILLIILLFLK